MKLRFTKILFLPLGSIGNMLGIKWEHVDGGLEQITCGPFGVVLGVMRSTCFYRIGINDSRPTGTGWREHSSRIGYISCGAYGCWGIKSIATTENICYFNYTDFSEEKIAGKNSGTVVQSSVATYPRLTLNKTY